MPQIQFANNAKSLLLAGISAGAGTLTVLAGEGAKFPNPSAGQYFYLTLEERLPVDAENPVREIVKCTARSGDTMTITRAQDGTSAVAWAIADKVELRVTRLGLRNVEFEPGVRLIFAQAAAPVGWTQDVSDNANNRMLRVVNAAGAGVGGSHSPILNNVVPAHTHSGLTAGTLTDHTHIGNTGDVSSDHSHGIHDPGHAHTTPITHWSNGGGGAGFVGPGSGASGSLNYGSYSSGTGIWTGGISQNHYHGFTTSGSSANHAHAFSTDNGSSQTNWTPRYVDNIICTKD